MSGQSSIVSCGIRFALIVDSPWTIYRHIAPDGTAWDVVQHTGIRERGVPIWQVFAHGNRRMHVLTSRWGDDIGPLYHCAVHDFGAMVKATAEHIKARATVDTIEPQAKVMNAVSG